MKDWREYRLHNITISTKALRQEIENNPELFGANPGRTKHPNSPHRESQDIWVRYNSLERLGPEFNDEHISVWHPAAAKLPSIRRIAFHLMAAVEGEQLGGILITKLPPKGMVYPHVDFGWHAAFYSKFYLPVVNEPGARFCFQKGAIEPEYGQVWEFDNSCRHWVENDSQQDRIALIICIRTHEREMLCPSFQTGLRRPKVSSLPT